MDATIVRRWILVTLIGTALGCGSGAPATSTDVSASEQAAIEQEDAAIYEAERQN